MSRALNLANVKPLKESNLANKYQVPKAFNSGEFYGPKSGGAKTLAVILPKKILQSGRCEAAPTAKIS